MNSSSMRKVTVQTILAGITDHNRCRLFAMLAVVVGLMAAPVYAAPPAVFVRDLDNAVRQSFEANVEDDIPNTFEGQNAVITTVPAGKLLVVEHVSVNAFLPTGQHFAAGVIINSGPEHYLVSTARGAFGASDLFEISQPIRLYAGPGATLNARADRDSSTAAATVRFTISGYMVNCGVGPGCPVPLH